MYIQGTDEVHLEHDSIMLEGGNTSFQVHLQVDADEFARTYNVAQAVAAPMLAAAVPETGRALMPLYQPLGDDGFFVMREFKPFWLTVSAALRRLRLDGLLPWLPGVHRPADAPGSLVIRRRVARWYAKEIFHLLGYRREREAGDLLVVSRRRET